VAALFGVSVCTALRKGSGANVHQRLLSGAKSSDKGASKWQQGKGKGRAGGTRGEAARSKPGRTPPEETSFLDSLNSY
jgi:hypothetical protein